MCKTVYTLVVVVGFVPGVQLICQPPVSIYAVEFRIEITKLVQQSFVLLFTGTFLAVEPFVVG